MTNQMKKRSTVRIDIFNVRVKRNMYTKKCVKINMYTNKCVKINIHVCVSRKYNYNRVQNLINKELSYKQLYSAIFNILVITIVRSSFYFIYYIFCTHIYKHVFHFSIQNTLQYIQNTDLNKVSVEGIRLGFEIAIFFDSNTKKQT